MNFYKILVIFINDFSTDGTLQKANEIAKENQMPWELSFSYGRGLQSSTLKKWAGKMENIEAAQSELISRCEQVSLARQGLVN